MMKRLVLILLMLSLLACLVSCSAYFYRIVFWNFSGINDYENFPNRVVQASDQPFYFKAGPDTIDFYVPALKTISYTRSGEIRSKDLDALLRESQTTAFIVIQDDHILIEKYLNGYSRESINRSFSVAKSITSILIGIAIERGCIKSVEDYIVEYLPELNTEEYRSIKIKHLLRMESGLFFSDQGYPWDDGAHLYYEPDLRTYTLSHLKRVAELGREFLYNNYCTTLLGMILERTGGMSITGFTAAFLWSKIGSEFPATWSLNREHDGLEQTASGFNARAIDFAKIGKLMLDKGVFNGNQVVSSGWIDESVIPPVVADDYFSGSGMGEDIFYGYQ